GQHVRRGRPRSRDCRRKRSAFLLLLVRPFGLTPEVERVRRLERGYGVFVYELDLTDSLQQQSELVESRHMTLKHHSVHQEQGHAFAFARGRGQEQVLQRSLGSLGSARARYEAR